MFSDLLVHVVNSNSKLGRSLTCHCNDDTLWMSHEAVGLNSIRHNFKLRGNAEIRYIVSLYCILTIFKSIIVLNAVCFSSHDDIGSS